MRVALVSGKSSRVAVRLTGAVSAALAVGTLAGQRAAFAQYVTLPTENQQISYTLTDFFDPKNSAGSFLSFQKFDTQGGTRELQAVQISLLTQIRTDVSATNNSGSPISGSVTVRVRGALYDPFNQFTDPAVVGATIQPGAFVASADAVFDTPNINAGQTVTSPSRFGPNAISASATQTQTYSVAGYGGPVAGTNNTNTAFVSNFSGPGTVDFGAQTFTRLIADYGGGNVSVTQATDAQMIVSLTYVYQPVPAPPAVTSLGIGSVIGAAQLGLIRVRRRRRGAKSEVA